MEKEAIGKKLNELYPKGAPLAALLLEKSRLEGNGVEIPSLGIKIPPYPRDGGEEKD